MHQSDGYHSIGRIAIFSKSEQIHTKNWNEEKIYETEMFILCEDNVS